MFIAISECSLEFTTISLVGISNICESKVISMCRRNYGDKLVGSHRSGWLGMVNFLQKTIVIGEVHHFLDPMNGSYKTRRVHHSKAVWKEDKRMDVSDRI